LQTQPAKAAAAKQPGFKERNLFDREELPAKEAGRLAKRRKRHIGAASALFMAG
jgi:hypothetical protein